MQDQSNDDDRTATTARLTRRGLLAAGAATLGSIAVAHAVSPAAIVSLSVGESRFMELSRLLIDHRLEPAVGRRLAAGLRADASPMADDIDALIRLAQMRNAAIVEDFFPQATFQQQQSALRIISAWYLGVVDDQPGAQVLAYELALMFQPTSDVTTIPTYAISRPNGWSSQAPPLTAMPIF